MKLGTLRSKIKEVPCIALTATATSNVVEDIFKSLKLKRPVVKFKIGCFRKNLFYDVRFKDIVEDPILDLKKFALKSLGIGKEQNLDEIDWVSRTDKIKPNISAIKFDNYLIKAIMTLIII